MGSFENRFHHDKWHKRKRFLPIYVHTNYTVFRSFLFLAMCACAIIRMGIAHSLMTIVQCLVFLDD